MTSHVFDYDVIIVGGGIVGLALACALGKTSMRCAIVESSPQPKPFAMDDDYGLRVSAITRASENLFRHIGVWDDILSLRHCPYYRMRVWEQRSTASVDFSAHDIAQENLGHIIENDVIASALWRKALSLDNVTCLFEQKGHAVQFTPTPTLTLADGSTISGKIIVGADGANSWLRQQIGCSVRVQAYDQLALVANIKTEHAHQFVARQIFLEQGPLAFLPMADEHVCSIVWSQSTRQAQTLLDIDVEGFNAYLTRSFQRTLGNCELLSERRAFPLRQTHAKRYFQPGCVLIGDAAHTIHPLAGQGLNIGLLDAACLAEVLTTAYEQDRPLASEQTLRKYERQRRWHNGMVMRMMDVFHYGFTSQNQIVAQCRKLGFDVVNRVGILKQPILKQALGVSGPLPELCRSIRR